jgi:hypothetical protein
LRPWKIDYITFLLKPYRKLADAKLQIVTNHIFSATTDETTAIKFTTRRSALPKHEKQRGDIFNRRFGGANRLEALRQQEPEPMENSGLIPHKQIKLFKNYLRFIPKQYHSDPMYQQPSKEIFHLEKEDQKKRKEFKKIKKETLLRKETAS